jgi:hypothetical protein
MLLRRHATGVDDMQLVSPLTYILQIALYSYHVPSASFTSQCRLPRPFYHIVYRSVASTDIISPYLHNARHCASSDLPCYFTAQNSTLFTDTAGRVYLDKRITFLL